MGSSHIREIRGSPFSNLKKLTYLYLDDNELTDESLVKGLRGLDNLTQVDLTRNRLNAIPNFSNSVFSNLTELYLSDNNISAVKRDHLLGMNRLKRLYLNVNPIVGFPEDENDTFAETPNLEVLDFDKTYITHLPNLSMLPKLTKIFVNNARLVAIPDAICCTCANLHSLEANSNFIRELPTLECKKMVDVDLAYNMIKTINQSMLQGMKHIQTLDLSGNMIEELDNDFFNESLDMEFLRIGGNRITSLPDLQHMPHLIVLNASYNRIREIKKDTFKNQVSMDKLLLNDNEIKSIHPNAFSVGSDLKQLNLSRNGDLKEWILPAGGFQHLAVLSMEQLWKLHQVPNTFQIPRVREIHYTYSYHCCIWEDYVLQENDTSNVFVNEDEIEEQFFVEPTDAPPILPPEITDCEYIREFSKMHNITVPESSPCWLMTDVDGNVLPVMNVGDFSVYISSRTGINIVFKYTEKVICTPLDNPLTPCENLMDPWVLRVAIWAVWVLALLGNGTVLFVGIAAREKLESSEFLICNLAFADFCMGLYLVFLATVDVRTFGTGTFYQSALDWQLGPGCTSAGFIAIFSNELSVYILVMLTLERVYTIASAFNQNEKKKKRVAIGLCILGWILAAVVASLPLIGINSYNHVAVCLPYLTEDWFDKLYIGLLLTSNLVGFVIILLSYIYIFYRACKNTPATHMPQRRKDILVAASKIAVLIFTAFLCWAPTALIGYLALIDVHLVSAAEAKYFLVFVFPLNACVNPFIYAIFTRRFRQKFASIFQRSNDKVTSFPPHHNMRLQRTPSAFTSEFQMSRVSSSGSRHNPDEMTKIRQSRRSNSLVVQYVDNNLTTPSPTFTPPVGCNLGRRASLPAGFGSTLNNSGGGPGGSRGAPCVPHCMLPFKLGSLYSSNTSSLPDLQEESDMEQDLKSITSNSPVDLRPHPLTSSQESNLRRLSVVVEDENEGEAPSTSPEKLCAEEETDGSFSESSSEDYSDASDSIFFREQETDLDFVMHGTVNTAAEVHTRSMSPSPDGNTSESMSESGENTKRKVKTNLEVLAVDLMLEMPPRIEMSSCSDSLSDPSHSCVPSSLLQSASSEEKLVSTPSSSEAEGNTNLHDARSISPEAANSRIATSSRKCASESSRMSKLSNSQGNIQPTNCTASSISTDTRQGLVLGAHSKSTSTSSHKNAPTSSTKNNQHSSTSNQPLNHVTCDEQSDCSSGDIMETDL